MPSQATQTLGGGSNGDRGSITLTINDPAVHGLHPARVIYVAAKLGIADHIRGEEGSARATVFVGRRRRIARGLNQRNPQKSLDGID